ncbi:MAG: hypothetical protein MK033_09255 [Candidatus Caenarcaniphilales bacterium]|nr:hypothetical protein [Candidatus Caenarcaniphilales bacterium]
MTTKLSKLQDSIKLLGKLAAKRNLELYIVGGMVREIVYLEVLKGADIISDSFKQRNLLEDIFEVDIKNEINFDLDLVINCDAINFIEEIQDEFFQEFKAKIIIKDSFKQFRTIKVNIEGLEEFEIEFASTRSETYSKPAAFPTVSIINDICADLPRRDFTINALLISLTPSNYGQIKDLVNGLEDMQTGSVKVFHDLSFIDDPTRIYRAFRFAAEYGFEIEEHSMNLMKEAFQHQDFDKWSKKRKNRFKIEHDKYLKILNKISFDSPFCS